MVEENDVKLVGSSLTKFTHDLYNELNSFKGEGSNIFISPYSIYAALSMVYAGARNNTASQMEKVLQIEGSTKNVVHEAHKKYLSKLEKNKDCDLNTANRLYVNKNFEILKEYFEKLKEMYHSESKNLDFSHASKASEEINNWVEDVTNGKIQNIIPDGFLNANTALVLVNAIYFKGQWNYKFDPNVTKSEDFFKSSSEKVAVDMMFIKKRFSLRRDSENDCQILELPYQGSCLRMFVILPNQIDGIAELEEKITSDFLQSIIDDKQFSFHEVEVKLPKFKVETSFELAKHLSSLGMSELFNAQQVNLSGISNLSLYVSEVFHKAFVEVNEQGTEAAAATAVAMNRCAMIKKQEPIKFIANHPFIFLILDKASHMILFMGKFCNP